MKASNCDLEDLWQGIVFNYKAAGRDVPRCWTRLYRAVHWLFRRKARG